MTIQTQSKDEKSLYSILFKNKALMLLYTGKTVSLIGDSFFNLAIMWVVFDQSKSIFQSSLVGVFWHLSSILFSTIAGALADRWDRKKMLVVTHLLSSLVIIPIALSVFWMGHLPIILAFSAIWLINCFNTFVNPVESSIIPEIVNKKLLTGAMGLFSSIDQAASLVGSAVAGFAIALIGAAWALIGDSFSFFFVAVCIALAPIPKRKSTLDSKRLHLFKDIKDGWAYIKGVPVLRSMLWISLLINVTSFIPSLFPALVSEQLKSGPEILGLMEVVAVLGAISGGLLAGKIEKKLKSGYLIGPSWFIFGVCTIVQGYSSLIWLTLALLFFAYLFLTIGNVCLSATRLALIDENYRGRVMGITRSISVIAMPLSSLVAGLLGDYLLGISNLFLVAGIWTIGVGMIAFANREIRSADNRGFESA